jgi:hypothetical protein
VGHDVQANAAGHEVEGAGGTADVASDFVAVETLMAAAFHFLIFFN